MYDNAFGFDRLMDSPLSEKVMSLNRDFPFPSEVLWDLNDDPATSPSEFHLTLTPNSGHYFVDVYLNYVKSSLTNGYFGLIQIGLRIDNGAGKSKIRVDTPQLIAYAASIRTAGSVV
ncbi:hypothetical protein BB561_004346 [Smittium simulii]|uniref:Uncharacterized protein n=1 Tax=Smittium simulii TaxID=133385 RepID=A0A2T9YGR3_9FUNG|nr:hypothetical protein BB561_004346 [Smittium simulii]